MIRDRRKSQVKTNRTPRKVAQADRSIGTSRAKRDAAVRAKRGLSKTKKANDIQIEQEVKRQEKKSAVAKKRSEKKVLGGQPNASKTKKDPKSSRRDGNTTAPDAVYGGRVPSRKAIEAAVKGMKGKGYVSLQFWWKLLTNSMIHRCWFQCSTWAPDCDDVHSFRAIGSGKGTEFRRERQREKDKRWWFSWWQIIGGFPSGFAVCFVCPFFNY